MLRIFGGSTRSGAKSVVSEPRTLGSSASTRYDLYLLIFRIIVIAYQCYSSISLMFCFEDINSESQELGKPDAPLCDGSYHRSDVCCSLLVHVLFYIQYKKIRYIASSIVGICRGQHHDFHLVPVPFRNGVTAVVAHVLMHFEVW